MGDRVNAFATARAALVDALDPVLPGRVFPYEPPAGLADRAGGPTVWLDVATPGTRASGSSVFNTVQFPVVISFDGSDEAQVAGLDELQAKVCDVIASTARCRRISAIPAPQGNTNRSVVYTVEMTVGVGSFCAPDTTPADIPPPIVRTAA